MGQTENGKWWPFEHFLVAIVVEKSSQVVMVELQSVVVDNIVAGVEVVGYSLLALVAIAELQLAVAGVEIVVLLDSFYNYFVQSAAVAGKES